LEFVVRIALFFDGNNFYRSLRTQYPNMEINYERLTSWVIAQVADTSATFCGAYYYTGFSEKSGLDRFLSGLEMRKGFFVRREPVVDRVTDCPKCRCEIHYRLEKRVDTRLVAEMVKMAALNAFDRAVVFSGDEDLVPALETVASFGKQVYVATWGGHALSRAMRIHSFGVIDLSQGLQGFATELPVASPCNEQRSDEMKVDELYTQLLEAWNYFSGRDGHVTRWYFENKWKSSGPCPPPGNLRQQLLDRLIATGKVELFEAQVNGRVVLALRPKR
jgi:uncharacterized LabA/DUF88 family protein